LTISSGATSSLSLSITPSRIYRPPRSYAWAISSNPRALIACDSSLDSVRTGNYSSALLFDGAIIWVANSKSDTITKLRASDVAKLGPFPVGAHSMSSAFERDFHVEDTDGYIICFGGRPMVG
jgi:hypothetical protein